MSFIKGEIVEYNFPYKKGSNVLSDIHRAVVLYSRNTPYCTTTIAPITSAKSLKTKNSIPNNYVELKKQDYPMILDYDSYINLDMITTVDTKDLIKFERNGFTVQQTLNDNDNEKLDYCIALSYELQNYLHNEVSSEYENIIEYVDSTIRKKINMIIEMIQDDNIRQLLIDVLDNDLINQIKKAKIEYEM